jgi:hypothetical protein
MTTTLNDLELAVLAIIESELPTLLIGKLGKAHVKAALHSNCRCDACNLRRRAHYGDEPWRSNRRAMLAGRVH